MMDRLTQDWKRRGLVNRHTPLIWAPGDHSTIFSKPNVDVLAELVKQQLDVAFEQNRKFTSARSGSLR